MSMAFFLSVGVNGSRVSVVVTLVGLAIQGAIKMAHACDFGSIVNKFLGGLSGGLIEKVGEVQERENTAGVVFVNEATELGANKVHHVLEAAWESNSILACWLEDLGKGGFEKLNNIFANCAAECSAHSDGTQFGEVIWVFVERHEIVGTEVGTDGWWVGWLACALGS